MEEVKGIKVTADCPFCKESNTAYSISDDVGFRCKQCGELYIVLPTLATLD